MPLYGFICEECSEEFEELVISASRIDEVVCPNCESSKVERQLSLVAAMKTSTGSSGTAASNASCTTGG